MPRRGATGIVAGMDPLLRFDAHMATFLHESGSPLLTSLMLPASALHTHAVVLGFSLFSDGVAAGAVGLICVAISLWSLRRFRHNTPAHP